MMDRKGFLTFYRQFDQYKSRLGLSLDIDDNGHKHTCAVLWNLATYGCLRPAWAVSRLLGLNLRSNSTRLKASDVASGRNSFKGRLATVFALSRMDCAQSEQISLISLPCGKGMVATIFSIWLMVLVPGKRGLPSSISARMQPRLHMSTPAVYFLLASRISGARYQRVATQSVRQPSPSVASEISET